MENGSNWFDEANWSDLNGSSPAWGKGGAGAALNGALFPCFGGAGLGGGALLFFGGRAGVGLSDRGNSGGLITANGSAPNESGF